MSDEPEIDVDTLSRLPLGLGCVALACLAIAIVLLVVGLFVLWQASDDAKLAADVAARGRIVTVSVTGKDITRSAVGTSGSRTTQFWLVVAPPENDPAADAAREARVPVSQAEHDATAIGDSIEVWRVDGRYVLDRVVSNPTPAVVGYALLAAGGAGIVVAVVLLLVIRRRVKGGDAGHAVLARGPRW